MPLSPRARRRTFIAGLVVALLVALYTAAGYLLAPRLVQNALLEQAARAGLQARIGSVVTHPFALDADANDVELSAPEHEAHLQARRIDVDLAWASLWRRAWLINKVQLVDGTLTIDRAPKLQALQLQARNLSTRGGNGDFTATAQIEGGGSARTQGTLALAPLAAEGNVELADAPLAAAWRYVPSSAGEAPKGRLSGSFGFRYQAGRFSIVKPSAQARLDSGGTVTAQGEVTLTPFAADLQLDASQVPLSWVQRFLPSSTQMRIATGGVFARGRLQLGARPRYDGTASLRDAHIEGGGAEVLAWQELATDALHLDLSPFAAQAQQVVLRAPKARVVIERDGKLNLAQLFAPAQKSGARQGERPRIEIAQLRVEKGEIGFTDRSLETPFSTTVRDLAGGIAGIATAGDEPARVQLTGRVGQYGDARVAGVIDLDAPESRTAVQVRFRNLALADFTPYAVKFAGYRIRSGRLSAQLRYRVRDGRLVGANQLVFDKLELGEKVANAGAAELPIDLAVALLTDAQGRINLAIPVSGDLRDPQFDLGGLIAKALRNTLGKIVSAPFRALASLFGRKGGAPEQVSFDAGSAVLSPPEQESVAQIARALAERPQLTLTIRGGYDPQVDEKALRRAQVVRELAQRSGYRAAAGGTAASAPLELADPKMERAAERLYLVHGGDLGPLQRGTPGYRRRLLDALAAQAALPPSALDTLAQSRARAVHDALVKRGVADERLQVQAPAETRASDAGVPVSLSLDAEGQRKR